MNPHVLIVGGGLAGSLLACYLGERGWTVDLIERRNDPRVNGHSGGRSINLAISTRGLTALRRAGLEESVLRHAVRMPGRRIHSRSGQTSFLPYSASGRHAINSIHRGRLNLLLLEKAASYPSVRMAFDERCTHVDVDSPTATFRHEVHGTERVIKADIIIGTDGAFSAIREVMRKRERFEYSQEWLHAGYKELNMSAAAAGTSDFGIHRMDPNGLHIWPRGNTMMIALPNAEGDFTCTLFWPHDGADSFAALSTDAAIIERFERDYPDALALIPDLVEQFRANPVGCMVTVKCSPWQVNGKVAIAGDAAHAIVPFYGQGANCAFEDCEALADCLFDANGDWLGALETYESLRKRHADAIADLARDNFHEMSKDSARWWFPIKKRIEHTLHALFPKWFIPLYEMISFSTIPYADARDRSSRQWRVVLFATGLATGLVIVLAWSIIKARA
ncbi:MAG: NAD(P)/FAD-dependent oxidoreductase [Planctomycetota bacterium]|nr:NAD(P)/FAD-dependent oxidoreductase [Planctomycetota bacterium]